MENVVFFFIQMFFFVNKLIRRDEIARNWKPNAVNDVRSPNLVKITICRRDADTVMSFIRLFTLNLHFLTRCCEL